MSSNATGDTQPEPAVIADEAPADVAGPSVAVDVPEGPAGGEDAGEDEPGDEPAAGAAEAGEPAGTGAAAEAGATAEPDGEAGLDDETGIEADMEADIEAVYAEADGTAGLDEAHGETGADGEGDADYADADGTEPVREFRHGKRWPRILLAVGFVAAAAGIVVGAIAIVGSLTHGFKKPVKVTYKTSAVFSLKTGDCLDPQGQQSYTLIACDSPHGAEVFATFKLKGAKWPGNTAAATAASSGCKTRLSGYLNPELAISLASTYVYPDAVAWHAGTRTVICEVRASKGQLTGSVRGASTTAG
jgi:hypothetical protein